MLINSKCYTVSYFKVHHTFIVAKAKVSMDLVRLLCAVLGILALRVNAGGSGSCRFPAIYNFGDSNSDTGAISAAIEVVPPPNGESFFGHSSGRFSDGRLIIDFIGEVAMLRA